MKTTTPFTIHSRIVPVFNGCEDIYYFFKNDIAFSKRTQSRMKIILFHR